MINSHSRMKIIEDLEQFLLEKTKMLENILNVFQWTPEGLNDEIKVQCPVDPNHCIPESSLKPHVETCSWRKGGYSKEEIDKEPPSSKLVYENTSITSMTITKEVLGNILRKKGFLSLSSKYFNGLPDVPKSVDSWSVDLNLEERVAVYDYIIEQSKSVGKLSSVTLDDLMLNFDKKDEQQDDKPKSELELLAEQRDYKRRRQSYRAKNVHITKKTYTEVMKEVIENQISFLSENKKQETEESKLQRPSHSRSLDERERKRDRKHFHDKEPSGKRSRRSHSASPKSKKHKQERSRSKSKKHKKHHKHKKSRKEDKNVSDS